MTDVHTDVVHITVTNATGDLGDDGELARSRAIAGNAGVLGNDWRRRREQD